MASTPDSPQPSAKKTPAEATAGDVLMDYLRLQIAEFHNQAPRVQANEPDAVHQLRMSTRRLRSALTTGKGLFDDGDGSLADIRAGLKWLSGVLGKARDPEVIRDRLEVLLQQQPAELAEASAHQRLSKMLDDAAAEGRERVLGALDSERYARLVRALSRVEAAPSQSAKAARPPRKAMLKLMAKEVRRLRRRARVLNMQDLQNVDGVRDIALHEVRKAAKRVRYAAEAASPVAGKRVAKLEKSAHSIQKTLGLHQDSVVARALLVALGARASADAGNGFTFGRLHALEEHLASESEEAFFEAWKRFPEP